jgi:hypothetical protein
VLSAGLALLAAGLDVVEAVFAEQPFVQHPPAIRHIAFRPPVADSKDLANNRRELMTTP